MKMDVLQVKRHLRYTQTLIELVKLFDSWSLDYRILKGVPLNRLLHGDQLKRESRDIDILIRVEDFEKIHHYLLSQGYQFTSHYERVDCLHASQFLMKYLDEIPYWHPEHEVLIDLKWGIYHENSLALTMDDLSCYEMIEIHPGCRVKTLTAEQNYHYLCLHGAKHLWRRRQWLDDLAYFQMQVPLSWEKVCDLAQKTGTLRFLLEVNLWLKDIHHIHKYEIVSSTRRDRAMVHFRKAWIQQAWFQRLQWHPVFYKYMSACLNLMLYASMRQKYRYIFRLWMIRRPARDYVARLKKPTPLKVFLCSLWPLA